MIQITKKNSNYDVISDTMTIQKKERDKTAQLLLLPHISINSSNDIQTNELKNTDQKQSLWISLISKYA